MTQLEDTGERMIPEYHKGRNIYGAHIGRYQAGSSLVKDKVVLDIACGSGYGTKMMASQAKKVYGVDVDKDTIDYAKEYFSSSNIEYKLGDGVALPLEDNSIDIVVSYETIEHIKDYTNFMEEVKRVLKTDGILLLSTPNDIEYAEGNHFHIHEFEYIELKALVTKYFKYHEDYFQTLWLYSSILPLDMQTEEWEKPINTVGTVPLKPEQCIYFFLLCSDNPIKGTIEPLGVIGEHYRQRALQEREIQNRQTAETLKEQKTQVQKLSSQLTTLEQKLTEIEGSKAWKIAKKLQKASYLAQKPLGVVGKKNK